MNVLDINLSTFMQLLKIQFLVASAHRKNYQKHSIQICKPKKI